MDRLKLLELWNDMWKEGNWVPSWPDSLNEVTAEEAAWAPDANSHSVWQEVVHVIFWRRVTLDRLAGADPPDAETVDRLEFAAPALPNAEAWSATVASLRQTHDDLAAAIEDESKDITRIPYHLIHDAYHLGRVTQLRGMRGVKPKF